MKAYLSSLRFAIALFNGYMYFDGSISMAWEYNNLAVAYSPFSNALFPFGSPNEN